MNISLGNMIAIGQVAISVIVIILILLQERDADAGALFGGGGGGFYQTRRGIERAFFIATIICIVAFAVLALAHLVIT